jgi:heme-degrading monooxygenase HmoA
LISRQWRGLARAERADDYVAHLRHETFPQLARIRGFVDATILRRPLERGVEFLIVTRWRSLDAIRQFAGAEAEVAVVPDEVQRMMLDYDRRVAHYEEVYCAEVPSG